ncbi:unnamed protein product [Ostreobium quekettii]|uniref:Uncharacterized protein n=1 Tax=Ostreobium quekettii TaxID=121088 RepID=A0A8S1J125_9CHLO|nr:unnamed protein product [Ostreobium quekettii]
MEFVMDVAVEAHKYHVQQVETKLCRHLVKFVKDCHRPQLFRIAGIASQCNARELIAQCKERLQEEVVNKLGSEDAVLHDICKDVKDCGQHWPSDTLADLLCDVIQRGSKLIHAASERANKQIAASNAAHSAEKARLESELQASRGRVAELQSAIKLMAIIEDQLAESEEEVEGLQGRIQTLETCIDEADCFVSNRGNLCLNSTRRPVRDCF